LELKIYLLITVSSTI